ncbi:carboxypeptidase M32 [Shewanella psychrotolerans]|uniref:carboxypeptidase M32 n=1 Tax=Shewanella psychrotolerans TaxID=2864206 RepID=UPI001C65AA87|nr:carboxypeptidase M32 [Shewanella psychrotolerans]QYK02208.1 carboxypeptidase M32 [Shewanella psychrotolerans]
MTSSSQHYNNLCQQFKTIYHFEHLQALGDWDQATMMPAGGSQARGEAMAQLALHIHTLKTSADLGEQLARAAYEPLSDDQRANLREMNYQHLQATALPGKLVQAKTELTYACEHGWREQRKNNDWQGFKPNLEAVIALVREEANILGEVQNIAPYDALINKFEPGTNTAQIDKVFGDLKTWLPDLISQVQAQQQAWPKLKLPSAAVDAQRILNTEVITQLGFDFSLGRLDTSSHPFSGGVPGDVRITTRYDEQDFLTALFSTIHETGHARYEQGLPIKWRGQPAGHARSMAIHESQSLFFEMQLARGEGLLKQLTQSINLHLNTQFNDSQLQQLVTRVSPGLIRVDADEVTYPCHIMLRYEVEKGLIDGSLTVADLPEFWDLSMQSLLGLSTQGDYRNGCMQDIHWPVGELGYFPSYSLGAMYAAQFRASMESQIGNLDSLISSGKIATVMQWLNDNIWSQGSLLTTDELVTTVTGETLNPAHFKRHLLNRYL